MKTLNTKSYRLGYATDGPTSVYRSSSIGSDAESKKSFYIRMTIMVVAACIFVFAASQIAKIFYKYYESDKIYANVANEVLDDSGNHTIAINSGDGDSGSSGDGSTTVEVFNYNHEALLAQNPDAVGYIYMPASNMRLPIVQGSDNDYYLDHSFTRVSNSSGCVFEDYDIKGGLSSTSVLLYGHHMKNDGMFAPLKYYVTSNGENYYHSGSNDVFYIYTENRIIQYKIFSVHEDEPDSSTYTYNFSSLEGLRAYAAEMKGISQYDTGVDVSNTTQIVTLSTCTATGDRRIVVQGTYVGEGVLDSSDQ